MRLGYRPRNRFASVSHGFLGYDGRAPLAILDTAREQLSAYASVVFVAGAATHITCADGEFIVALEPGRSPIAARRAILAFGLPDVLPGVPGIAERWGQTVLHRLDCHGYEFSDRRLGVLGDQSVSIHQAMRIAPWGPTTRYLHDQTLNDEQAEALASHHVSVETMPIAALMGEGAGLSRARLADDRQVAIDALYLAQHQRLGSAVVDSLGLAIDDGMLGPLIRTDGNQMTSLAGVYAAGDIARASRIA